jgi:hypothetical protein
VKRAVAAASRILRDDKVPYRHSYLMTAPGTLARHFERPMYTGAVSHSERNRDVLET